MGGIIIRGGEPETKRDGLVTGITLALAVLVPPVGLLAAGAFAIQALRNRHRSRAVRFLIIAGVAIVVILFYVLIGMKASTGHSGGMVKDS